MTRASEDLAPGIGVEGYEPAAIWLEPRCCADPNAGRTWCEDDAFPVCEDGKSSVKYIRADLSAPSTIQTGTGDREILALANEIYRQVAPLLEERSEPSPEDYVAAILAALPSVPVGGVVCPTCQNCGGPIEGWICQHCAGVFKENDAGNLVFATPSTIQTGAGNRENLERTLANLHVRDDFIVSRGLWNDFTDLDLNTLHQEALAALPSVPVGGWRPIDTLPHPVDAGLFYATIQTHRAGEPFKWEVHLICLDDETHDVHVNYEQGWSIDSYEFWQPGPTFPEPPATNPLAGDAS